MPQAQASQAVMQVKRRKVSQALEGQTYSASVEIKDPYVYYDTYTLDASALQTTLFNNAAAKARSLSNYQYQQLPNGQAFDVGGLRVSYYGHALMADATQQLLIDFLNKSVLQVQINNKVPSYERNLAALFGGQVQVVTAPAVTVGSRNLSVWTANTLVQFKKRIKLDQSTQWTVNILKDAAPNAALTGDYLRVEMIGKLTAQL
jgi:hypothetical protein